MSSPQDVVTLLKSQPTEDQFLRAVNELSQETSHDLGFDIRAPEPKAAQIIQILVNNSIPDFWNLLQSGDESKTRNRGKLISCLTSIAGVGAILTRIRALVSWSKGDDDRTAARESSSVGLVQTFLDVLGEILSTEDFLHQIIAGVQQTTSIARQAALQNEIISLLCSGKIVSVVAEAQLWLRKCKHDGLDSYWAADGDQYTPWFAVQIAREAAQLGKAGSKPSLASQIFDRAMSIGYSDILVTSFCGHVFSQYSDSMEIRARGDKNDPWGALLAIFDHISSSHQKSFIYSILGQADRNKLVSNGTDEPEKAAAFISLLSAVLRVFCAFSVRLNDILFDRLIGSHVLYMSDSVYIRRALVLVLAQDFPTTKELVEQSIKQFGDPLYIRNASITQQEALAQTVLISTGYLWRDHDNELLKQVTKESYYLNMVSERLKATSERCRFLGMIIATALSEKCDDRNKRLTFGLKEIDGVEGRWYRALIEVNDFLGHPSKAAALFSQELEQRTMLSKTSSTSASFDDRNKPSEKKNTSKIQKRSPIIEDLSISSSTSSSFQPYPAPDSDPEDTSSDPTLIDRNPPKAPVYISQLLPSLRSDDYATFKLALSTAPSLISRKTSFGTELSQHAEQLAAALVSLQNQWSSKDDDNDQSDDDEEDKDEAFPYNALRQSALTTLLTSNPESLAPWFAATLFKGDFSLSQRSIIISTLALGARSLSGLDAPTSNTTFPSQTLPPHLHALYTLSSAQQSSLLLPSALSAADAATGPSALKIRTFSSRLAVESKRAPPKANALAQVVERSFILPLLSAWTTAPNQAAVKREPWLLAAFVRALALILHAAGPSPPGLAGMSDTLLEFYAGLLLGSRLVTEWGVVEALLLGVLGLLDGNGASGRDGLGRFVRGQARRLLEVERWAAGVVERVDGRDEEGGRVKGLAVGVLMRFQKVREEGMERILAGEIVDF